MHNRNLYVDRIRPYISKPVIKVITGMRRVGKSCFLQLIISELRTRKIAPECILYINKESLEYDFIQNYRDLYNYVNDSFSGITDPKYLFVDEIQEISGWEKAVLSYLAAGGFDIYITGSNAHLLSSDIATLIAGRYIEIPVYSLSFKEFLLFRDRKSKGVDEDFSTYLWAGGYPAIHHFDLDQEVIYQYIGAIYNTILLKDVILPS